MVQALLYLVAKESFLKSLSGRCTTMAKILVKYQPILIKLVSNERRDIHLYDGVMNLWKRKIADFKSHENEFPGISDKSVDF